jgi:hypothetical protein
MGSIGLIIRNIGPKIAPWSFCLRIVHGIWIRPVASVSNKCMRYVIHSNRHGRHASTVSSIGSYATGRQMQQLANFPESYLTILAGVQIPAGDVYQARNYSKMTEQCDE